MKTEPVEFEVDGLKLRGRLYQPAAPKPIAVLFLHGWTGLPNEDAAKRLAEHGYTAMTFSLSGHNDSDGRLEDQTRDKSLKEILAAYDTLKSKLTPSTKIVAAGNSYGGYMSALLSKQRTLAAISLRVPANYIDQKSNEPQIGQGGDDEAIMKWRNQPLSPSDNKTLKNIADFKGPIQIIEAEFDERVPHQTVQNYADAINDKSQLDYHFMKGWPHSLGLDPTRNKQYQELLLNWLALSD